MIGMAFSDLYSCIETLNVMLRTWTSGAVIWIPIPIKRDPVRVNPWPSNCTFGDVMVIAALSQNSPGGIPTRHVRFSDNW
jgi:hypothetical protein